jgi:hypothetical protein
MLDGLGPARPWLEQRLQTSTKLAQPRIRMFTMPRRRTIDPIKCRRNLQDLAPGLEKVVLENIRRITRFLHEFRSSVARSVRLHHGKTRHDMQTFKARRWPEIQRRPIFVRTASRPRR